MRGIRHQSAVFVKQTVVNAPGVNSHGRDTVAVDHRFGDGIFDFKKDAENVPGETPVHENGVVGKPMVFTQGQPFTVKSTDNASAAGCAKVNCKHFQFCHNCLLYNTE